MTAVTSQSGNISSIKGPNYEFVETHLDDKELIDHSSHREVKKLGGTEQLIRSMEPSGKRAMELLHKRAKDRAMSLRWNLNGLMFIYALLIIIITLVIQNISGLFIALVAVAGLLLIWIFSSLQVRRLEKQFYQQEIHDYAELLSAEPENNSIGGTLIPERPTESSLTPRELEIITHMASGKRNKEIACKLSLSENTIKNHISNIFNKLEIYDRTTVVLLAIRYGWIKYDTQNEFHLKPNNI